MAMDNIPVLGIEEIAFEVKDLERSVAFYQNVIGLSLRSRGPQQAWFRVGQQSLALFTTDRAGSGQHFAFLIPHEKAEQARRALVAQGFPEERPCSRTMACRSMCAIRMETKLSCMASDQMPNQAIQPTATARVRTPSIAIVGSFSSWSSVSVLVRKPHPLQFERWR